VLYGTLNTNTIFSFMSSQSHLHFGDICGYLNHLDMCDYTESVSHNILWNLFWRWRQNICPICWQPLVRLRTP